jgi:vacuolar protein sorting-associated protein 13A/C
MSGKIWNFLSHWIITWLLLYCVDPYTDQIYAFWRPCAPPGYAILGDYLTPLSVEPLFNIFIFIFRDHSFSSLPWILYDWFQHDRDKPPTKGVVAVNTNFARVKRPISFKLIWPPLASEEISGQDVANSSFLLDSFLTKEGNYCSIWFPEAPKGYVALGCVVSPGRTQPPLSAAFCISASLVSSCSLRDCITINSVNS